MNERLSFARRFACSWLLGEHCVSEQLMQIAMGVMNSVGKQQVKRAKHVLGAVDHSVCAW
jgi:hypothetical protein